MNRRETLKGLGLLAGSRLLPPALLADFVRASAAVRAGEGEWKPVFVSAEQGRLLAEMVDVIIPPTDTPGARDALVHVFADLYVRDCLPKPQQEAFLKGLDEAGRGFLDASKAERLALLARLEAESLAKNEPPEQSFVRTLKNITLLGYFSSEPGATRAAEYEQSPGPFDGCVDLKPGQKVHALD